MLERLGIDAVALDGVADDAGRRLVENLESVAWNGIDAGFAALERTWPGLHSPGRPPVRVTIMGAGRIGRQAVEAATKYGSLDRNAAFERAGLAGVEVVTIGRNLTGHAAYLQERLSVTDLLVDATQRTDASTPIVRNAWLAGMPDHAVVCDLVVDPYLLEAEPRVVRGIEGIPQGDLDRWELDPTDPAWDAVPASVPHAARRTVVSCYSWPGVRPEACMRVYGAQLAPVLETLVTAGGLDGIRPDGSIGERAVWRATLRARLAAGATGPVGNALIRADVVTAT
jgi:alanine dehydrogenase